eukprot:scaffold231832_cov16-Tisochrysis_lutea.AAC.1
MDWNYTGCRPGVARHVPPQRRPLGPHPCHCANAPPRTDLSPFITLGSLQRPLLCALYALQGRESSGFLATHLLAALGQGACCCCCRMMATRASLLGGSTPLSGCIEASEAWFWLAELGRLGRLEVAERGRWMGQGSAAGAGSVLGEAQ